MRSVISGLFVALLVAEPALAGSILYATAASQQRIDGFCLGADGALAATPTVQIPTLGRLPRRVLVGNGVLYVAEADRIEAFAIGQHGGLRPLAGSEPVQSLNPQDLTLNPDGKTLYVTHLGFLEAFALDAEGGLPKQFTSCVQGENTNDFLDAQATSGLLYVSADDVPGRIAIYRLNADGSLPQTGCGGLKKKDRPAVMRADSARKRLQRPKAFIVVGDFVYVEERSIHRLTAFRLQPDGTFCDKGKDANGNVVAESCGDLAYFLPTSRCARHQAKEQHQQCAAHVSHHLLLQPDHVHSKGAVALVLLADPARDQVDVGLSLLNRNPRFQPHEYIVVFVASVLRRIGCQWKGQKHIELVHRLFRGHHFRVEHEAALQDASNDERFPVERDALAENPWITVEESRPDSVGENGCGRFAGLVLFRQQQTAQERLGAEHLQQ